MLPLKSAATAAARKGKKAPKPRARPVHEDAQAYGQICARMATLEFMQAPGTSESVTFYKDYGDDEGRRGRLFVHFGRMLKFADHIRLTSFTYTLQAPIFPTAEGLADAPGFAKSDVQAVLSDLAPFIGALPSVSLVTRICAQCRKPKSEFYVVNDDAVCFECVDDKTQELAVSSPGRARQVVDARPVEPKNGARAPRKRK